MFISITNYGFSDFELINPSSTFLLFVLSQHFFHSFPDVCCLFFCEWSAVVPRVVWTCIRALDLLWFFKSEYFGDFSGLFYRLLSFSYLLVLFLFALTMCSFLFFLWSQLGAFLSCSLIIPFCFFLSWYSYFVFTLYDDFFVPCGEIILS